MWRCINFKHNSSQIQLFLCCIILNAKLRGGVKLSRAFCLAPACITDVEILMLIPLISNYLNMNNYDIPPGIFMVGIQFSRCQRMSPCVRPS